MTTTEQLFNDGAAYERLMGRWSRRAGEGFLDWLGIAPGLHWIEIGCGTGAFTEDVQLRCSPAFLIGIDPSAEQLAFARKRPGLQGAEFRVGDAEDLPFAAASFDVAAMALVVQFLSDPPKAIAEMARVLRPGGLAATYVWDYAKRGSPTAPVAAAIKAMGVATPVPPSRKATAMEALQDAWRAADLAEIETRVIRISVEFEAFEEFWESMTARVGPVGKAIAQMSADELEKLRGTLRERMSRPDGRVIYEAVANAIKGRKP